MSSLSVKRRIKSGSKKLKDRKNKKTRDIIDNFLLSLDVSFPKYIHYLNAKYGAQFYHFDFDALEVILDEIDKVYDNIDFEINSI